MAYSYDRTAAKGESFDAFWEAITYKGNDGIRTLDESFVGTRDYMGIAYFWNLEYKFKLRDTTTAIRRAVHTAFLKEGLELNGESPAHAAIIDKLVK